MKHFLQTISVFLALAAAKPLDSIRSRACDDVWTVGKTVYTTSGAVQGHPAPEAREVSEYLGIPFAQPPTGSLRFQPPLAHNKSSIVNGTDYVSPHLVICLSLFYLVPLSRRLLTSWWLSKIMVLRDLPASKQAAVMIHLRVRTV